MAVYVTSDAHGHVRALDEVLERVSLGAGDELYVLGDLIDRGPDPLGVVSLVRSLPNAHVLLGNHEDLMMLAVARTGAPKARHASACAPSRRRATALPWRRWTCDCATRARSWDIGRAAA